MPGRSLTAAGSALTSKLVQLPPMVEDAAYVAVGFGVLAFQRAQVRRRQLERLLEGWCPQPKGGGDSPPTARTSPGAFS